MTLLYDNSVGSREKNHSIYAAIYAVDFYSLCGRHLVDVLEYKLELNDTA